MAKKLKFYYSAMNAGKTLDLLKTNHTYERLNHKCWLIKPSVDTRSQGKIESRLGISVNCTTISKTDDIMEKWLNDPLIREFGPCYKAILADEAQFFTASQIRQLARFPDEFGIPVLCYGLRTDSNGNLFEGSQELLAIADELTELITLCHCGSKAKMNLRLVNNKVITNAEQVCIGAEESYVSVCRKHWFGAIENGIYP